MSTPFRERNSPWSAASPAVVALLEKAMASAQDLPLIGGGDTYYAAFTESGGLKAEDEVRIAGASAGQVTSWARRDHVSRLPGPRPTRTGTSRADIRSRPSLGSMFLASHPGGGEEDGGGRRSRRRAPARPTTSRRFPSGPGRRPPRDRHRPARHGLDHDLADLTRNTPRSSGRRSGRLGAVVERGGLGTRDEINSLLKNLSRVSTVLDARDEGHRRADERLRHPVPGAGARPGRRSTGCWSPPWR